jgi:hypothetical protein
MKPPSTITHLIDALNTDDQNIKNLIQALPEAWSSCNARGAQITKQQLTQCTWGQLKELDSLQEFQQAILTTIPPPTDTVTQYHTHLTSAISSDNIVWQHTIQNACQNQILPHPLFNPITRFNIHHNSHFTSLITNNQTYYYYDSLNLQPPPTIHMIHNTLRQWYTGLTTAPPPPTTHHTGQLYTKYPPTNRWMDVWHAHAPHQPHNHIPRTHPHTHTHPTTRGIPLPIPAPLCPHRGTRNIHDKPRTYPLHNTTTQSSNSCKT